MFRRVTDRVVGRAAAAVDRAVTLAVEARSRAANPGRIAVSHATRVAFLERLLEEYPSDAGSAFFEQPPPITPWLRRVRAERGRQVLDVTWTSAYDPYLPRFRERYSSVAENQLALARLFVSDAPRPLAVLIHGYMSGKFAVDERLWPIAEFSELGYDVALFVLPFHGLRGSSQRGAVPAFPGTDPRMTVEGFRHAVWDLRAFLQWLRRERHARVGLMGMSLGGYTASLVATIDRDLEFLVPVVPLACLADFSKEQRFLSKGSQEAAIEHRLLERVYRSVSPLAREPRLAAERVLVVGARADRVTPIAHARRLAGHFGAPLVAFPGGHLLQVGRRESFLSVLSLLSRLSAR